MSLREKVAANLPFLRRYARALTGSQEEGDNFVRATLEAVLSGAVKRDSLEGGRVLLYHAFNIVWGEKMLAPQGTALNPKANDATIQQKLGKVTPLNRQALLLTTLESFSADEAATILDLSSAKVEQLVKDAIAEMDHESATSVLIIEDEPLISMQLEELVSSLGHEICGTAATRTQAQNVIAKQMPGLVLADIQLADGSSGLDTVDDILSEQEVPVIFITAYPERLLTGDRPEPTFLVTKPFQESTVRAAISQALFLK